MSSREARQQRLPKPNTVRETVEASCHRLPFCAERNCLHSITSLDHLVGAGLERSGHLDAQSFSRFEIDDQLQFVGLLDHRHFSRIEAFQDLTGVHTDMVIGVSEVRSVTDQRAATKAKLV